MSPKKQQQAAATIDLEMATYPVQDSTAAIAVADKNSWMRIDRGTIAAAVEYALLALIAFLLIFVTYLFFYYTSTGLEPALLQPRRG